MKTAASEDLRKSQLESALEKLYYDDPYLIDPKLANGQKQIWLSDDSRTDLLFTFPNLVWVVEIKRGKAGVGVVRQIERYLKLLGKDHPSVKGTIIAGDLNATGIAAMKSSPYKINFKKLIVDIPIEVKYCRSCRRAYDSRKTKCPYDGEKAII